MGLAHTRLENSRLGVDAQRALGSAPGKMMAARGMAPIGNPRDMLSLMYQLALDDEDKVRAAAMTQLGQLPAAILLAGLQDEEIDPRVLDFFARKVASRSGMLDLLVLNGAAADETICMIATFAGEEVIEIIATNEQRLLRHPDIIYALYMNTHSRMSTVDRCVELAVRNQVRVPGLQAWDEICAEVLSTDNTVIEKPTEPERKKRDKAFKRTMKSGTKPGEKPLRRAVGTMPPEVEADMAQAAAPDEAAEAELEADEQIAVKPWREMSMAEKIRMATIGNDAARAQAIMDPKVNVAMAALKSPGVNEADVLKWAANNTLDKKLIAYIAHNKVWTKNYGMKLALINNPKTPCGDALRFLSTLREKDLRAIARSRAIPGPVVQAAKKLTVRLNPGSW